MVRDADDLFDHSVLCRAFLELEDGPGSIFREGEPHHLIALIVRDEVGKTGEELCPLVGIERTLQIPFEMSYRPRLYGVFDKGRVAIVVHPGAHRD